MFIEFLNILDDKLLGTSGYWNMRRDWKSNMTNFSGSITRDLERIVKKQLRPYDNEFKLSASDKKMHEYNYVIR